MKFNVGDKVKVKVVRGEGPRRSYVGQIFTVESLNPNGNFSLKEHYGIGVGYIFYADELELVEQGDLFSKSNLKTGMVVEVRDYPKCPRFIVINDRLVGPDDWTSLSNYNEDLVSLELPTFTIDKVYQINPNTSLNSYFDNDNLTLLWERRLPADSQWVRATERLPHKDGEYLCVIDRQVRLAKYAAKFCNIEGLFSVDDESGHRLVKVDYWMDVPSLPEEDDDD